jgi:hypothetical protein
VVLLCGALRLEVNNDAHKLLGLKTSYIVFVKEHHKLMIDRTNWTALPRRAMFWNCMSSGKLIHNPKHKSWFCNVIFFCKR